VKQDVLKATIVFPNGSHMGHKNPQWNFSNLEIIGRKARG
jgi:hypothetical protein